MSTQAISAPISSLSLLLVQTQASRWKVATPEQLTCAHLYLDIAKSGYLFHGNSSGMGLQITCKQGNNTDVVSSILNSQTPLTHCGLVTPLQHKSGSILAQVMACCLMVLSHCLIPCWFIMKGVLWHSPESNFTSAHELIHNMCSENITLSKLAPHLRDQQVNCPNGQVWVASILVLKNLETE